MKTYVHGKLWDGDIKNVPLPSESDPAWEKLFKEVHATKTVDKPSYQEKMLHQIESVPVVERDQMIVDLVAGKTILDLGASGMLHQSLVRNAKKVYGLDLQPDADDVTAFDFEDLTAEFPVFPDVDVVVAGEIVEHLTMPGFLLRNIRRVYPDLPLIVSVPNAFSQAAANHIRKGSENVNRDHVAWYSPKTLEWLLARCGYTIKNWAWYNGQPMTAEGILAVAEPA